MYKICAEQRGTYEEEADAADDPQGRNSAAETADGSVAKESRKLRWQNCRPEFRPRSPFRSLRLPDVQIGHTHHS
jgi:hypothetical protein